MNAESQALSVDNMFELNGGRNGLKRILLIRRVSWFGSTLFGISSVPASDA